VIAQHQGGGKADQLFLRGFDADHGTDVAIFIDDVPVNMPSHGHGQGFADLHFLIPEVIDRIDVSKGPYFPEYGDFDTAGAINLHTRRSFGESSLQGTYGSFETYRVLGVASSQSNATLPWLAAEVSGTQGPFQFGEELQRYNVFSKETLQLDATTRVSALISLYGSQWRSSGQLPLDAVEDNTVDRFGSLDPTEGGQTQRQMLVLSLEHRPDIDQLFRVTAYGVRYQVALFSDFTFALRDPVNLDEIEQDDARTYTGLDARYQRTLHLAGMKLVTALGAQGRFDDIHTQLWHDKARTRLSTCFDEGANPCDDALIGQTSIGAFLEEDARIRPWLRVVAGVRTDLYEFNVQDQKPPPATPQQVGTDNPPTTGLAQRSIINPKLQVVLKPLPFWDIYLDGGGGFHSNDARAVIAAGGSGALPRAWGGEVGSRVLLFDRLDLAAAVWDLHLQSEEVFDADEDTTSAAGPTNRYGLDLEARWAILPWLWADGDLALAHAVYTQDPGNANAVALAPTVTSTAGITALHPDGYRGRLGTRFVGTRCATEDCSLKAQGYTLFDLSLGYRRSFWEIDGVIENLTDAKWMEAQFATTYQLRGPGLPQYNQTSPDTNIAFTPGNPRNGRVIVSLFF
jgi:outer membrane receptor protein involved in Fe transport